MGKTYGEKLRDPRWQRMRLEVLATNEWKCQACGSGTKTLHVHHAYYVSGRDPWEYPHGALHSLCEECHDECPDFGAHQIDALMRANTARRERETTAASRQMAADLLINALCAWLDAEEVGLPHKAWLDECEDAIRWLRAMHDAAEEPSPLPASVVTPEG